MRIRSFKPADAAALARLFYDSVHEIANGHYSSDQLQAWAPAVPSSDRFTKLATDGRVLLVAVGDDDEPLAFADMEPDGHIDHIFCRPDAAGKGVASRLYDRLEAWACDQGLHLLYVEASELSHPFFIRKGFHVTERADLTIGSVTLPHYRMEKGLASE